MKDIIENDGDNSYSLKPSIKEIDLFKISTYLEKEE